jgi:hypothetical protein
MSVRFLSGINVDSNTLFVDSANDRVGIGTASPSEKFSLYGGDAIFTQFTGAGNGSFLKILNSTTTTNGTTLQASYFGSGGFGDLKFEVGGSERLRITSAGNVGIGTTAPPSHLSVVGNIESIITVSTATVNYLKLGTYYAGQWGSYVGAGSNYSSTLDTDLRLGVSSGGTATEVIRITAAGNVGIGTTSPVSPLDVNGIISSRGIFVAQNSGTYNLIYNASNSVSMYLGGSADQGNYYDNTTHYFRSSGGSSTYAVINYLGNVGIGTTAPGVKLDVLGVATIRDSSGGGALNIGTSSGRTQYQYITLGGGNGGVDYGWQIGRSPQTGGVINDGFYIYDIKTNNTPFAIALGGNVGIGTTSPSYTLDVSGTARTTTGTYLGTSSGNVIVGGTTSDLISGFKFIAIGNTAVQYAASTGTYLRIEPGAADTQVALKADARSGAYPPMAFHTSDTERLRITAAGNVGIGTTAPTAKLDISAGTNLNLGVQQLVLDNFANDGVGITFSRTSSDDDLMALGVADSDKLGLFSRSGIVFATGGTSLYSATSEVMRIAEGGNVGIGTTSPAYKLDVSGVGNFTNIGAQLVLNGGFGAYEFATTTGNDFTISLSGTAERMRITSGGNVGIGTTAPGAKLDIVSTGTGSEGLRVDGASGGFAFVVKGGSDYTSHIRAGATIGVNYFTTPPSNGLIVEGNVGIGTTSPESKLHVASGDVLISNGQYYTAESNTGGNYKLAGLTSGNVIVIGAIDYTTAGTIFAGGDSVSITTGGVAGSTRIYINSAGNVGIGTTSPTENLHVYGTGNQIIKIENSGTYLMYLGLVSNEGYIGSSNATPLTFYTNNVSRMYITTGGNVGIGTTAPAEKLQVAGNVAVHPGQKFGWIYNPGADNNIYNYIQTPINGGVAASAIEISGSRWTNSNVASVIFTHQTGGQIMTIMTGGNVGIGTTAPVSKLQVNHSSAPSFNANGGANALTLVRTGGSGAAGTFGAGLVFSQPYLTDDTSIGVGGIYGVKNNSNGTFGGGLAFFAQPNSASDMFEVMRITSAGDVGIGTTAPSGARTVIKTPGVNDANEIALQLNHGDGGLIANQEVQLGFGQGDGTTSLAQIGASYEGSSFNGSLIFRTNSASLAERLRITSAGNIFFNATSAVSFETFGVAHQWSRFYTTSSTDYALVDVGNATTRVRIGVDNSSGGSLATGTSAYASYVGSSGAYPLQLGSYGGVGITINSSNNVGIGTTAPGYKLEVYGSVMLGGTDAENYIIRLGKQANSVYMGGPNTNTINVGYDENQVYNLHLNYLGYQASTTQYRNLIVNDGRQGEIARFVGSSAFVGIGNSAPSYKLDVTGDVRITSGSLGVGVVPNATDGRIDASNDIVAFSTSDERFKENITPIANALEKVKTLTGVEFDWRKETKDYHGYVGHDVGVIAQQVKAVLPEAVRTNANGYLAVRYEKIIGLLVEAMKEQQAQIEELKSKLK